MQSVQPRYRSIPFIAAQLAYRRLAPARFAPLTIGAKQRASGGDYSHWNGPAGFHPQNGEQGLSDFAIGKLTEGTGYTDESFAVNWPGYEWHPVRGAYHYARSQWSGAAQADYFLRQAVPYLPKMQLLAWDFESYGNVFSSAFMAETIAALDFLRGRFDGEILLYTNRSLRNWLRSESIKRYSIDVFLQYGFWYAAPLFTPSPDANPVMPTGVDYWDIYQYTWIFDGRRVGINDSTIDYNVYNGTRAQMLADFGVSAEPPPPEEPPMDINLIKQKVVEAYGELDAAQDALDVALAELIGTPPPPAEQMQVKPKALLRIRDSVYGTEIGNFIGGEVITVLERIPHADTSIWVRHSGSGTKPAGWSCQRTKIGDIWLVPFP